MKCCDKDDVIKFQFYCGTIAIEKWNPNVFRVASVFALKCVIFPFAGVCSRYSTHLYTMFMRDLFIMLLGCLRSI